MTNFAGQNAGPTGPFPPDPSATLPGHPPGRAQRLKLLVLSLWLALGFWSGVLLAFNALPRADEARPQVAAPAAWHAARSPALGQPRFWRPAGSNALRPVPRLEARVYRPALRLAGNPMPGF